MTHGIVLALNWKWEQPLISKNFPLGTAYKLSGIMDMFVTCCDIEWSLGEQCTCHDSKYFEKVVSTPSTDIVLDLFSSYGCKLCLLEDKTSTSNISSKSFILEQVLSFCSRIEEMNQEVYTLPCDSRITCCFWESLFKLNKFYPRSRWKNRFIKQRSCRL